MIKFFRKNCQRLITDNYPFVGIGRISKHLIYAVGEIIFMVIGILIACPSINGIKKDLNL